MTDTRGPRPPAPDAHAGRALALGVRLHPPAVDGAARAARDRQGAAHEPVDGRLGAHGLPRERLGRDAGARAGSATCSARRRCSCSCWSSLVVGSVLAALTSSMPVMLMARVIQGAGGAIFPLAFSIMRDEFPRERVAGAIGMLSALIGVGARHRDRDRRADRRQPLDPLAVLDPGGHDRGRARRDGVLGARVADHGARRGSTRSRRCTLSGWLVCLLLGVSEGGEWGWTSARVIGLFAAAVVLFAAWLGSSCAPSSRSSTCA